MYKEALLLVCLCVREHDRNIFQIQNNLFNSRFTWSTAYSKGFRLYGITSAVIWRRLPSIVVIPPACSPVFPSLHQVSPSPPINPDKSEKRSRKEERENRQDPRSHFQATSPVCNTVPVKTWQIFHSTCPTFHVEGALAVFEKIWLFCAGDDILHIKLRRETMDCKDIYCRSESQEGVESKSDQDTKTTKVCRLTPRVR